MARSARGLPARGQPTRRTGRWIDTYAGEDYQGLCASVGELIETSVRGRLGDAPAALPRWASLSKRFRTATRLEIGFWEMGLRGPTVAPDLT